MAYDLKRHQALADKWIEHAKEAGHNLETAKYDRNIACTYIRCCVKGCKWEYEREVGFSRLPSA